MNARRISNLVFLGTLALSLPLGIFACTDTDPDAILKEEKLYSQFNEELIIRHFFNDRRDGFFLDVGAYQWNNDSTTYYLEEKLGWSGIAIDAQAGYGGDYALYRKKTRFFGYLVGDTTGDNAILYRAGPFSSTDPDHLKVFKDDAILFPGADELKAVPMEVPTITLNDLLEREGVDKVTFMSMDIEGSEPPALAGFDIERYAPELVCIEVGAKTQDAIVDYFANHGYERIEKYAEYDMVNWYYEPKSRN